MDVGIILAQMLMLLAMMMVGYFIWKKGWLDEPANKQLSKIVVNIFNPLMVLYGVMGKDSEGDPLLLLQNAGFVIFFYVFLILIGIVIAWAVHPAKSERNLYRVMTVFPNVGFMGIPVITSIFGKGSTIYIVFYMLGYNILLYTYGMTLVGRAARDAEDAQAAGDAEAALAAGGAAGDAEAALSAGGATGNAEAVLAAGGAAEDAEAPAGASAGARGKSGAWKRMVNPGTVAALTAVAIFLLQIPIPDAVVTFCDYMGNATIPLSMILIGVSIAKSDLKTIFSNGKMYLFTAIRMVALPIALILLLKRLPADPMVFGVFALELAMPVGSILTLMAKECGADEKCCTNGIVLGTLASIVTIPLVCLFL